MRRTLATPNNRSFKAHEIAWDLKPVRGREMSNTGGALDGTGVMVFPL